MTQTNDDPEYPEGAFAYLTTVETPSIKEYKILALIEAAGLEMYNGMAECSPNAEVKKILAKNGQEELAHAHRLKRIIKALYGEDFEIPNAENNPYRVDTSQFIVTRESLEAFAAGEVVGGNFYESWAAKIDHPEAARWLRQNGKEEIKHSVRLREAAELLT